jgi:hypothetical protein
MGEVIGAGLLAHVPTIVLPDGLRRELNDGKEISLHTGLHRLRKEVFDELKPDLVLVCDRARTPQGFLHERRTAPRHVERSLRHAR